MPSRPASLAATPRASPPRSSPSIDENEVSPTQVVADVYQFVETSDHHEVVDDFCGVDPVLAQWARPLLTRLRGPVENWPSAKDFCDVPLTEPGDDARSLNVCFAQIDDLRESKDDLEAAGSRPLPQRMNALPVEVALFCLSRVTGFPDKLVKQVFETMKAASLRKDLELHIKSSLRVLPRAPSLGIAAPGSKKTPVQQELINRVFCKVLERFPFLAHVYSWLKANSSLWLVVKGHGPGASLPMRMRRHRNYIYVHSGVGSRYAPRCLRSMHAFPSWGCRICADMWNKL